MILVNCNTPSKARYRVRIDREGCAIAGLSLDGGQTLRIGLENRDCFAWLNATLDQLADNPEAVNEQLRLLWIAIGKGVLGQHTRVVERLSALGINHEYYETEGYHIWSLWRNYLSQFVPRLWQ